VTSITINVLFFKRTNVLKIFFHISFPLYSDTHLSIMPHLHLA